MIDPPLQSDYYTTQSIPIVDAKQPLNCRWRPEASGPRWASALRIEDHEPVARPGLRVHGLVGGDDGHAEFEPLANGLARWQVGLDATERRAIIFGCLRRRSDLRGLP